MKRKFWKTPKGERIIYLVLTIGLGSIMFYLLSSSKQSLIEKIAIFISYTLWCFAMGLVVATNIKEQKTK